jgi:hypothetical protein
MKTVAAGREPTETHEPAARRSILPRRALPSGRAVMGALLITIATVGSFAVAAAGDAGPGTEYLVLRDRVQPGDRIQLDDVEFVAMVLSADLAATALQSTSGLEGAIALQLLRSGDLLDTRDLRGAAVVDGEPVPDVHELTIPVPRDRAPTALRRGDRVTILAFDESRALLRTALEDALVLDYDTDTAGVSSSQEARLTVALPDADLVVEATLWSYESLTVVLTSRALADHYVQRFRATTDESPS